MCYLSWKMKQIGDFLASLKTDSAVTRSFYGNGPGVVLHKLQVLDIPFLACILNHTCLVF